MCRMHTPMNLQVDGYKNIKLHQSQWSCYAVWMGIVQLLFLHYWATSSSSAGGRVLLPMSNIKNFHRSNFQ
jgi:hypothetical protein